MQLTVTTALTNELKGYCRQCWAVFNKGGLSQVVAVKRRTCCPALASAYFFLLLNSCINGYGKLTQIKKIPLMKNIRYNFNLFIKIMGKVPKYSHGVSSFLNVTHQFFNVLQQGHFFGKFISVAFLLNFYIF